VKVRLNKILSQYDSALIALSGGVDSSLVAKLALDTYGNRALAVISSSESLAKSERDKAVALCREIGIKFREIQTNELSDPKYRKNDGLRCFACKTHLYRDLSVYAQDNGFDVVMDGANADDLNDYRPGRKAATEHSVVSPLAQAGVTKEEVRQMARKLGLPNWNKPASACLASRVPYGTEVTKKVLSKVEVAEEVLRNFGFKNFRVRHHGDVARLEVALEEFDLLFELRKELVQGVKKAGYIHVSLDLEGFRSGSMNAVLSK